VAGAELVGQLAAVHEHRLLALADDQLGAVLDLVLVAGEPPRERRAAVVEPFDDVDEFALELRDDPHTCPSGRACTPTKSWWPGRM
jgi:hypothetical protein